MSERLPTDMIVKAHLRQLAVQGINATVIHKGDDWGGAILLQLNLLNGTSRLLTQITNMDGDPAWLEIGSGAKPMAEADSYIKTAIQRDPDLWVVEIEDRLGRNPFPGKIT